MSSEKISLMGLDGVELLLAVEEEFFLVKDLIRVVSTLDSKVWTRDEVYSRIKKITIEQLGIRESKFHPNANFVRDFGID